MSEEDETAQTQGQRTSNLARIRENQRRSRARRKEYLQELETKYRSCEQLGVEASGEIQAAARRVIEENRRLRQMLLRRGFSEAEIDAAEGFGSEDLGGGGGAGALVSEGNSPLPPSPRASAAVSKLEGLLEVRRECRPNGCGSGRASGEMARTSLPPPAVSPAQHAQSANYPQLRPQLLPNPIAPSASGQSSRSSISAQHSPNSNAIGGMYPGAEPIDPMQQQQRQQQPQPQQHQQLPPHQQYALPYDRDVTSHPWMQQYDGASELPQNMMQDYADPVNDSSSSCYVAADTIRSLNPALGYELEMEMGCRAGEECNVPNMQIFDLMDRYSGGQS